jgi:hypothetical protein
MKVYQQLASSFQACQNCIKLHNAELESKHLESIEELMKHAPSGSGFDTGTEHDVSKSNHNKLVFHTSFHHMNDLGYYVAWTEHDVIITPSLVSGFSIKVTGRDTNQIKDYIADSFWEWLNREV